MMEEKSRGRSVLTAIRFGAVAPGGVSTKAALWPIAGRVLVQVVAHVRWFLHIDLSRQKCEGLQLILFTALLLAITAGGTIWIMRDRHGRMM